MYRTKLEKILKEEGRTQTWLAGKIGKSIAQTNQWVLGRIRPEDETKRKIAEALGRTVEDIFFSDGVGCCDNRLDKNTA